jgi:hypothetical protein
MDLAAVIRQSLSLWHNPSFTELPAEDVVSAANRCFMRHSLELDLTLDAVFYNATSASVAFADADAREIVLADESIDDISRIERVESRPVLSTNDDEWEPEIVSTYGKWPDSDADITFYSGPDGLVMVTGRDRSSSVFRIIYRALRETITEFDAVVDIPGVYESVFVYDLALEMGELIDNRSPEWQALKKSKMQFLLTRFADESDRVEKWRRRQHPGGVIHRKAFNDRRTTFDFRRRKITVTF